MMEEDYVMDDQQSQSLSLLLGPATFIPQPTLPPFTPTPLSSLADSQSQTSMAKPLGRTQTLAQIATTPPFPDVFSTPVSTSASSSLFQHRDSSAALSDDDEEDDCDNSIKIDVDNNDWEDGTQPLEEDVTMGEPQPIQPQSPTTTGPPASHPGATLSVITDVNQNAHRHPSPVPTEPEDPDPEFISNQLAKLKIKVRDYGMCPPYTTSTPPTVNTAESDVPADISNNPNARVPLTPETFDPYKALGEFEYRLRQLPRTLPIPGKTLRRLIEIGWVSEEEVTKRCNAEDLSNLQEFDERNRVRALKLSELRKRREVEPGAEEGGDEWDFDPKTGSYPYITLQFDSIPTRAERDGLVTSVRPLFVTVDRVVRMAMAMERERERDRLEAEEALNKRKREQEEREEEESRRVEMEMLEERAKEEREESEEARKNVGHWIAVGGDTGADASPSPGIIKIPPIGGGPTATARKRSPHQAWADDDAASGEDNEDGNDLEAKRLRLARSQSEVWYEQERRQQQAQAQQILQEPFSQSQPPNEIHSRPQSLPRSQSPRKNAPATSHSRNPSSSTKSHSRSQSQPTNFIPPEKQYPAPLSAYDPELYPDAASVIESQSQSQGRHVYNREDTPPADEEQQRQQQQQQQLHGHGGRGIGLGEEGEEDTRPNALKRSPKKALKRGLTRGRTLVQIC